MLDSSTFPKAGDLIAAIKKRLPGFESNPAFAKPDSIVGTMGRRLLAILLVNAPNPLSPNESFIRAAWWWPDVSTAVAKRKAHIIVNVGSSDDPREDYLTLAKAVAAVMETSPAIGVIWDSADAIWPRDMFMESLDRADTNVPTSLFVSVKLGRDTNFPKKDGSAAWLGMTYGLRAFGLKEVEFRGYEGQPSELAALLLRVAAYLLLKGDVIKDGETMGETLERQHQFKFEPSTLESGKQVYRMRVLVGAPPARPSQVVK
jgi:hypothetical protein